MQHSPVKTWKDGEEKERNSGDFFGFCSGEHGLVLIGEAVEFCRYSSISASFLDTHSTLFTLVDSSS